MWKGEKTARKLRQVHRQTCCEYSGVPCLVIVLVLFSIWLYGFWVGVTLVLLIFLGCDYPCFCLCSGLGLPWFCLWFGVWVPVENKYSCIFYTKASVTCAVCPPACLQPPSSSLPLTIVRWPTSHFLTVRKKERLTKTETRTETTAERVRTQQTQKSSYGLSSN